MLGSILSMGALGVGLFLAAYIAIDVPEPEDVALADSSSVYYADGTTEMGSFASVNRSIIDTDELPEHVGQAIIASEDRRFYSNAGVDPSGIARALVNNVLGKSRQGASTITQQYVERYYTGEIDGYWDKFKEVILALKIDREQSKDEILGNYMNTIYFGRGANGIEEAAMKYFDKPAEDLDLSESALIAGIIPAPSRWDPAVDADQAEARWDRTLNYMVDEGFITQAERDDQTFPDTVDLSEENRFAGPQGYLLDMARSELLDEGGFTEEEILSGGLDIVTTIDPHMQEAAVASAEDLPEDHASNLRVGLVSIDPSDGAIRALYGGHDYVERSRNAVTQDRAQGGSTFKIFTLLAALDEGMPLEQRYPSYSPMTIDPYDYEVNNFDQVDRGSIDLVEATRNSVNTSYAQLNADTGPEATVDMATRLGLPEDTLGLDPVVSNVLGSASPRPIDMARAFSTIAAGGERTTPHIVEEVADSSGSVQYTGPTATEQVIDEQDAADANYAMSQVVASGTGSKASELGRPAAGKTGSSQEYRSAWFVGSVPQLTTAVAMYQPDEDGNEEVITPFGGVNVVSGGSWPTTVWTEYMKQAVTDMPVRDFPERSAPGQPSYGPEYGGTEPGTEQPGENSSPTQEPSQEPSDDPSREPTEGPSDEPTDEPSDEPSQEPSDEPTDEPSDDPSQSEPPDPDDAGGDTDGG